MVIASLSVPSCFEVSLEFLETLKDLGYIDNFEMKPQQIILYFTYLKKDQ